MGLQTVDGKAQLERCQASQSPAPDLLTETGKFVSESKSTCPPALDKKPWLLLFRHIYPSEELLAQATQRKMVS